MMIEHCNARSQNASMTSADCGEGEIQGKKSGLRFKMLDCERQLAQYLYAKTAMIVDDMTF